MPVAGFKLYVTPAGTDGHRADMRAIEELQDEEAASAREDDSLVDV